MYSPSKYSLLASFLVAFSIISLSAQTPITEATRSAEVFPQWPGCKAEMGDCSKSKISEFIISNLRVPDEAKAQGAGGVVMVEFVIEKNGNIGEVRTLLDPGFGLGKEAVRVVSLMNEKKIKWTPAEDKGKRIPFRYMTPVSFNLARPVEVSKKIAVEQVVTEEVYDVVDVMPRYAGCEPSVTDTMDCTFMNMISHIQTNLKYPDTAQTVGVQGPVVVEFVVDSRGLVTEPTVIKSLGFGCDEEAVRVISLMPIWQPGLMAGIPVSVRMVIPILFQISKPEKEE